MNVSLFSSWLSAIAMNGTASNMARVGISKNFFMLKLSSSGRVHSRLACEVYLLLYFLLTRLLLTHDSFEHEYAHGTQTHHLHCAGPCFSPRCGRPGPQRSGGARISPGP